MSKTRNSRIRRPWWRLVAGMVMTLTVATDALAADRAMALSRIEAMGTREWLATMQRHPLLFMETLIAAAPDGLAARLEELGDHYPSWNVLISRLQPSRLPAKDPVDLLLNAVDSKRGDSRELVSRLAGLILESGRRRRPLVQVLQDRGLIDSYADRLLNAAGSEDYVQRIEGSWCDATGVRLGIQAKLLTIGRRSWPATYRLATTSAGDQSLWVDYHATGPARMALYYQPERDRLLRSFKWEGRRYGLHRCSADGSSEAENQDFR